MIVVDPLFRSEQYHGPLREQARRTGARNDHMLSHMMSTTSLEELDAFAARLGMWRSWRDSDHYDLTPGMRARAVKMGAREITVAQSIQITRWQRLGEPLPDWAQESQPSLL